MGNTCSGPNLGNNGFLQSVSAAVWRGRPDNDRLPPPSSNKEQQTTTETTASAAVAKDGIADESKANSQVSSIIASRSSETPPVPVQNIPPGTVKIVNAEFKDNVDEPKSNSQASSSTASRSSETSPLPVQSSPPQPVKIANAEGPKADSQALSSTASRSPEAPPLPVQNIPTQPVKIPNVDEPKANSQDSSSSASRSSETPPLPVQNIPPQPAKVPNADELKDSSQALSSTALRTSETSVSAVQNIPLELVKIANVDEPKANTRASSSTSSSSEAPVSPIRNIPPESEKFTNEQFEDNAEEPKVNSQASTSTASRSSEASVLPAQNSPLESVKTADTEFQTPPPVKVKVEDAKPVDTEVAVAKPKPVVHIKRVSSAGLRVESVLGRKTGNMKELYSLGRKLGQGQFGTTFLCLEKGTNKEFACKSIAKRKLLTKEDVEDVRREIQIMHHLAGHPNVVSIVDAYEDAVAVHVIMELCVGGELFDRIIQRGHYSERQAAQLARVIVGVVEACHSLGVMHRDLKPENFLFTSHDEEAPLKTIDFGLSVFFKPGEMFNEVVGSPYYVAPEVLRKHYGPECDVWSAGVIIYILLSGVPPFWDETEQGIFEQVLNGELDFVSEPWPSISDGAKDLVRRMLIRNPKKRLTAHEVLCHPWIQDDDVAPDKPLDSAVLSRLKQFSAWNKLKKIAIRVIAESLSEEEIAGLREMFNMIDTDNSGHITLEELKTGLEKVGANLRDTEITSLMQAADIDNSGTIDYKEFVAAMLHLNKVEKEDNLYAAFSYFDKDGSGYITLDELQQACEQFGLETSQLEEAIREADQDNDGRIDYSEFVTMMQDTGFGKGVRSTEFRKSMKHDT